MKKTSLALAAAGLLATTGVSAQSVEIFGLLDSGYLRVNSDGNGSISKANTDGNLSSRLGFRGTEDLGGGLKAGFWLEAGLNPTDGSAGTTSTTNQPGGSAGSGGLVFGRRSTVSLSNQLGELRLGRDYTPGFWNLSAFSPFGTNGIGSTGFLFYPVPSAARITHVRASNSVGYFLPKLGGFYGQAMVAFGNNPSTAGAKSDDGNVTGLRLGYEQGPFNIAVATNRTQNVSIGNYKQNNLGASYDFGPVKAMALWGENVTATTKTSTKLIGAHVPVGPGQIRLAYSTLSAKGVANDANHLALGYVHNLSKRTAVYGHYARISNKNNGTAFDLGQGVTRAGGSSTGYEFGIRHTF
ncbi:MAG: porin [Curvibacter lanceolatus]|jgi:predicted porin|uniref:porin n=1 Tax=Curvibacter lanceolatus TaxID=86182 RepID=UPI002352DB9F|nr:porin [Curvibacter lanceolatus]MBV5292507.1 porin [Curvibacter lanceolatus]